MASSPRANALEFGFNGGEVINDTAVHDAPPSAWGVILVVADAVIESITFRQGTNTVNESAYEGITLYQGFPIYGYVTQIKLSSGVVHCYNG